MVDYRLWKNYAIIDFYSEDIYDVQGFAIHIRATIECGQNHIDFSPMFIHLN